MTCIAVLLAAWAGSTSAQHTHEHSSADADTLMEEGILHEVTVQGLTGSQRLKDAAAPFMVIAPKVLHQTQGSNLMDAISRQPGLAQITTGAGIAKPVIRGMGYNRVVVVDQGIRLEGQQWGDEHGIEADAQSVHSVEVLKGPASLMYGSDAIAGVMILHPERPLPEGLMQVKAGAEYQSNNGLYGYTAGFAGNKKGWLWNGRFSDKAAHTYKNDYDGRVPGSGFKERDITGMLGVSRSWGHSWLRVSNVDFKPGIVEGERDETTGDLEWGEGAKAYGYSNYLPFQRVRHLRVVSDNAWYTKIGTLKGIVGYQQNRRQEFEESAEEAALDLMLRTVNYDLKYQVDLEHDWKVCTGVGGMWQSNENSGEEALIPNYWLFDFGLFATASKQFDRWNLSGGLRYDNRSTNTEEMVEEEVVRFKKLNKHFNGYTGSVGAVWNANEKTNVRLNVARGYRAPTVSELSSNGVHEGSIQYELGQEGLKPEHSLQTDLGVDFTSRYVALQASLFVNRIDNYVFLGRLGDVMTDGYATYQYRQGDARLMGGEVWLDVHPLHALHISNSFSYVHGLLLHQPHVSRHLPRIPAPRWNCNVRYEFPDFGGGHCKGTYICAEVDYNLRQDNYYALDNTETATPSYAVVNLSVGTDLHVWKHNCIELTLACNNLLNKTYQNHLNRLKYADWNTATGRQGVFAMGRNVCVKVSIPIDIHL